MNIDANPNAGTYYPNVPGARTLAESTPLYIDGHRVSAVVDGHGSYTVFVGTEIAAQGELDGTEGALNVFFAAEAMLGTTEITETVTVTETVEITETVTFTKTVEVTEELNLEGTASWFKAEVHKAFQLDADDINWFETSAYRGYIAYNMSMTDGHYAPEAQADWIEGFRADAVGSLYWGNDNRHELAPFLVSYLSQI